MRAIKRVLVFILLMMTMDTLGATCPEVSEIGVLLVKKYEGFSSRPYIDADGSLAIGYGSHGHHINKKSIWTEEQADKWLRLELEDVRSQICEQLTESVSSNEMAALTSLTYNIGFGRLLHSGILLQINEGRLKKAAIRILRYNKSGGIVLHGLTRRRHAEMNLFLLPDQEN